MANKKVDELSDTIESGKKNEPFVLLWKYQKLYEEKYNRKVVVNKFRDKSAMQDVIESIGFARAMELLEYYFRIPRSDHKLLFFLWNFDKLDVAEKELTKDKEKRRLMMEATKRLVEGGDE